LSRASCVQSSILASSISCSLNRSFLALLEILSRAFDLLLLPVPCPCFHSCLLLSPLLSLSLARHLGSNCNCTIVAYPMSLSLFPLAASLCAFPFRVRLAFSERARGHYTVCLNHPLTRIPIPIPTIHASTLPSLARSLTLCGPEVDPRSHTRPW